MELPNSENSQNTQQTSSTAPTATNLTRNNAGNSSTNTDFPGVGNSTGTSGQGPRDPSTLRYIFHYILPEKSP